MSVSTPIFTVICWACAGAQARAAPTAAMLKSFFIRVLLLSLLVRSAAHQWAAAVLQWAEGFLRRNGRAGLVEVAEILGLRRLLDLEQIGRMQLAAVGTD